LGLGSQSVGFVGQSTGLRHIFQRFVQCRPQRGKLLGVHDFLHSLEELALFFADVLGQLVAEISQAFLVETAGGGACEVVTEKGVLGEKFVYQGLHLRKARCCRKQFLLFGREVDADLLFKLLLDLRLPGFQINLSRLNRTIEAHAQRQRVLVLAGKRDQVRVTQHTAMINDGWPRTGVDARAYIGKLARACQRPVASIRAQGEPIGAHPVPLLNEHAIGFE